MNDLIVTVNQLPAQGLIPQYQHDLKLVNRWLDGRPINVSTIQDYLNDMKGQGRKPSTINRHKAAIKKSIESMSKGEMTLNEKAAMYQAFREIKGAKPDGAIGEEKYLTVDEYRKLINQVGYKTGLLIQALFCSAMRISELVNIRLTDCTKTKRGIMVKSIGKGSRARTVFLPETLFDEIREAYRGEVYLFETVKKEIKEENEKKRKKIVLDENGNSVKTHLATITAFTLIRQAGRKIGRPDLHPHMIRHTWASLSLEAGVSLPKVSGYLGHSNLQTTTRFYLHGKPKQAEINDVNSLISGIDYN